MKWFGESWGAPCCDPNGHVATPTAPCAHCDLPFTPTDRGLVLPFAGGPGDPPELPYHQTCMMNLLGLGTVHILKHGVALCDFQSDRVPGQWPARHTWVSFEDPAGADCSLCIGVHEMKLQRCPVCKKLAAHLWDGDRGCEHCTKDDDG